MSESKKNNYQKLKELISQDEVLLLYPIKNSGEYDNLMFMLDVV